MKNQLNLVFSAFEDWPVWLATATSIVRQLADDIKSVQG